MANKKLILLAFAVSLAASILMGCGGEGDSENENDSALSACEHVKIITFGDEAAPFPSDIGNCPED